MAGNPFDGPLNAGRILQTSSSQEALNLDAQAHSVGPAQTIRNVPASEHEQKHRLQRWWQRHVCPSTPHDDCRDHFGEFTNSCVFLTSLTPDNSKRKDCAGVYQDSSGLGNAWCCDSTAHALAAISRS